VWNQAHCIAFNTGLNLQRPPTMDDAKSSSRLRYCVLASSVSFSIDGSASVSIPNSTARHTLLKTSRRVECNSRNEGWQMCSRE